MIMTFSDLSLSLSSLIVAAADRDGRNERNDNTDDEDVGSALQRHMLSYRNDARHRVRSAYRRA